MKYNFIAFALLITFNLASQNISHPKTKMKGSDPSSITKIIIIRHAEKADDGTKDPPLNDLGKERAVKLNALLADFPIEILYATPFKRTQQTLGVIADARKLKINTYQANDSTFVDRLIKESFGKTVVVAGHSNSAPALVNKIIGQEKYKVLDESIYTKLWVITLKDGQFISDELWNY